jgi:tRNA G18 (ribose-2'-O)-methylase SpoU
MPQLPNKQLFVIAHNIRSLHNVGSIFRTADALGVSKVYLTGYTGTPPDPKIAKVALGAEDFVPWEKYQSAVRVINKLRKQVSGIKMVALENNVKHQSLSLIQYQPKFPLALLLGEETVGLNNKLLNLVDDIVEIPMLGQKESLNVSVAFGITAYTLLNKNT